MKSFHRNHFAVFALLALTSGEALGARGSCNMRLDTSESVRRRASEGVRDAEFRKLCPAFTCAHYTVAPGGTLTPEQIASNNKFKTASDAADAARTRWDAMQRDDDKFFGNRRQNRQDPSRCGGGEGADGKGRGRNAERPALAHEADGVRARIKGGGVTEGMFNCYCDTGIEAKRITPPTGDDDKPLTHGEFTAAAERGIAGRTLTDAQKAEYGTYTQSMWRWMTSPNPTYTGMPSHPSWLGLGSAVYVHH